MPNKVTWKKGMRLTPDVFTAQDASNAEAQRLLALGASGGRMGIFAGRRLFELSVNVEGNTAEVLTLRCTGLTKTGRLVDIDFDSNFGKTFDTSMTIPSDTGEDTFLIVVKMVEGDWRQVDEHFSEPTYLLRLVSDPGAVDGDSLPVGRLVNQYGWRLDEVDFVPPCLYVNAHHKFIDLMLRAESVFKGMRDKCLSASQCVARQFLASIWNAVSDTCIEIDKLRTTLTPEQLLSIVQKVVASFVMGATLDPLITLENANPYVEYSLSSIDLSSIYSEIERGVGLCSEIALKLDTVLSLKEEPEPTHAETKARPRPETPEEKRKRKWAGIEV